MNELERTALNEILRTVTYIAEKLDELELTTAFLKGSVDALKLRTDQIVSDPSSQDITLELRNRGFVVNHKKVQRLMKVLGLTARIRRKRKYSSYQGEIGKKADNLIQRQFEAIKPMQKCYTDVTEFAIPASSQKLYLSPVLDGFNSEIVSYNLSTSPNLLQMKAMLEQAFTANHYENTILHSDQGWQYQHDFYHHFLKNKGIQPSMSRK